jgi:hypothetical protein
MRSVTSTALCALVLGVAAGLGGCGGDDLPADTAAKVGDTTISTAAVQRKVASLAGQAGSPDARRAAAVRDLILGEWIAREARRRGLSGANGRLDAAAVERLRGQLLAPVSVGDKEVKRYYAAHRSEFGPPRKRTAWMLHTRTQADARAARDNLNNAGSWSDTLDRAFARDETSGGGALPFVEHHFKDKRFGRALFSAPIEQVRGPFKTSYGYYVYEAIGEIASSPTPPAKVRPDVEREARVAKLERSLQDRYGDDTDCAERFRVRAVPECA